LLLFLLFAYFLVTDLLVERREHTVKLGELFLTFREALFKGLAVPGPDPFDHRSHGADVALHHLELLI
jgi:kynureninase